MDYGDSREEDRFRAELAASWGAVFAVGQFFNRQGCAIWIPGQRLRPGIEQRQGYGDTADLRVRSGDGQWKAIEVKHRKELGFTSRSDYPFPTVFVDRKEKADKVRPYAYIIVNRAMTHAAIVYDETRQWWKCKTVPDTVKGYPLTVYECPVERVEFVDLESESS